MAQRAWEEANGSLTISWNGEPWRLGFEADRLGLCRLTESGAGEALLSLQGLGMVGRCDLTALGPDSLVQLEVVRNHARATFTPQGWGGLQVRASWTPTEDSEGIELEIQATASSLNELKRLEVYVGSTLTATGRPDMVITEVESRDARAAGLTYDGREPMELLQGLVTHPIPESPDVIKLPIFMKHEGSQTSSCYVELIHPHDVARRISTHDHDESSSNGEGPLFIRSVRHGFFGLDLEKGVVLRGRIQGHWFPASTVDDCAIAAMEQFLSEPLPLGN